MWPVWSARRGVRRWISARIRAADPEGAGLAMRGQRLDGSRPGWGQSWKMRMDQWMGV